MTIAPAVIAAPPERLTAAAGVVARRAGLVGRPAHWLPTATWCIAGYLALNTVGNLASTSNVERWAFGPATATASSLTAFVALRPLRGTRARPRPADDRRAWRCSWILRR